MIHKDMFYVLNEWHYFTVSQIWMKFSKKKKKTNGMATTRIVKNVKNVKCLEGAMAAMASLKPW